jgi:hypothetical protein
MFVGAAGEESPPPCPHCGARPRATAGSVPTASWSSAPPRYDRPELAIPLRHAAGAAAAPPPRPQDYSEAEVLARLAEYKARAGMSTGDRVACEVALWMGLALLAAAAAFGFLAWDTHNRRLEVDGVMSTRTVVVGHGYNAFSVRVKYQDTLKYTVGGKDYERTWPVAKSEIRDVPVTVYYFPETPDQGKTADDVRPMAWVAGACVLFALPLTGVGLYGRSRRPAPAA